MNKKKLAAALILTALAAGYVGANWKNLLLSYVIHDTKGGAEHLQDQYTGINVGLLGRSMAEGLAPTVEEAMNMAEAQGYWMGVAGVESSCRAEADKWKNDQIAYINANV